MVDVSRVRSVWSGFIGGPGVTTMYFLDTATAVADVHAFWVQMAPHIPNDVSIQVESAGDVLNSETGELTGTWTADAVGPVVCSGAGAYAAPVGIVIDWLTTTVAHGRRLRGRTFIVPCIQDEFDTDGTLVAGIITGFESIGEDLIAAQSTSFVIWHRGTGTDGSVGLVTSAHVPDLAAVLRSRRD